MPTNSTARVIPAVLNQRVRRSVRIDREATRWKVGYKRVTNLGFTAQTAATRRQGFARLLLKLGKMINDRVDAKIGTLPNPMPDTPEEIMQVLAPALDLRHEELDDLKDAMHD